MSIIVTVLTNLGLILKFWDKIEVVLKMLQTTPEEKHAAIVKAMQAEAEKLRTEGRPSWD